MQNQAGEIKGLLRGLLAVGLSCFIFLATRSLDQLRRVIPLLFWGALFLSLLTLIPTLGWYCHGSRRWLVLAGLVIAADLLAVGYFLLIAGRLSPVYFEEKFLISFQYAQYNQHK